MASILLGAARAVNTEVADCVHFLRDPSNSLLSKAAKAITKLALPLIAAATIGFIAGAAVGSPLLGCCIAVLTASLLLAYAMRSAWGTLPSQQGSQISAKPPASPFKVYTLFHEANNLNQSLHRADNQRFAHSQESFQIGSRRKF